MKPTRVPLLLLTMLLAALSLALLVSAGRAAQQASGAAPNITLAVDTTAGMAGEVGALSAAWDNVFGPASGEHCDPFCLPPTFTYKLISFRDQATLVGATGDAGQISTWLSGLPTGGDGTCRDHALGALWQAAHLSPRVPFSSTDTLLLTDSAPWGNRAVLARTINLLARARVSVNPHLSGWCPGAPLPPAAMSYLAAGTGGLPPLGPQESPTLTLQILLSDMTTPDTIAQHLGGGLDFDDAYDVPVDASVELLDITVLAVNDPCSNPFFPCPPTSDAPAPVGPPQPPSITVQLRDPAGNLVQPGTPGVKLLESEGIYYLRLAPASYNGPLTGTFKVEINGAQSGYMVRASASSGASLTLLSPHTLPADRPAHLVVGLLLPAVQAAALPTPQPTEELFGAYNFSTGQLVPLQLKDDGLFGDGQAGDGIYGGFWIPSPGQWQIRAYGHLADGSPFQRVVAAPLRVQSFHVQRPADKMVLPGDNVQLGFSLTNEESDSRTFQLDLSSQMGWAVTGTLPVSVTLAPGETALIETLVQVPAAADSGLVEETTLTALAAGDNPLDSVSATVSTTTVDQLHTYLPAIFSAH